MQHLVVIFEEMFGERFCSGKKKLESFIGEFEDV